MPHQLEVEAVARAKCPVDVKPNELHQRHLYAQRVAHLLKRSDVWRVNPLVVPVFTHRPLQLAMRLFLQARRDHLDRPVKRQPLHFDFVAHRPAVPVK